MRNPYIVGRWIRGQEHYGRQRLVDYLIASEEPATWVVGTRRMGKTSLLRQIEWLLDEHADETHLVPLFWDLQGSETAKQFADELCVSLEETPQRLGKFGLDSEQFEGVPVIDTLRHIQRVLRADGKTLLLLIDEAEALVNLAKNDDRTLAQLRKLFQSGSVRTIMVATKHLMRLNEMTRHWITSPFLFGVSLVNLWSLDNLSSEDLVLQRQSDHMIEVDAELLEDILMHTHRHPYLIQYLCSHLFEPITADRGTLRPIRPEDLQANHLLAGFFQVDFEHLAPSERRILLTVARHGIIDEETLIAEVSPEEGSRLSMFIYGMNKLGYLRQVLGQWSVGNEFLRRWTMENFNLLAQHVDSDISDSSVASILATGRQIEIKYLRQEMIATKQRLDELLELRGTLEREIPIELANEIQAVRDNLESLRRQLADLDVTE